MGKAAGRGNECVRERRQKNAKKKKNKRKVGPTRMGNENVIL